MQHINNLALVISNNSAIGLLIYLLQFSYTWTAFCCVCETQMEVQASNGVHVPLEPSLAPPLLSGLGIIVDKQTASHFFSGGLLSGQLIRGLNSRPISERNLTYSCKPKIWNSLTPQIRQCRTLATFRRHLKTNYFPSVFSAT